MQKKIWYILLSLILFVGVAVGVLLQSADLPNTKNNGFTRNIAKKFTRPVSQTMLGEHVTRISGLTNSIIFLSGKSPQWLLKLNYNLNVIDTMFFGITASADMPEPAMMIDSPYVYMFEFRNGYSLYGRLDTTRLDTIKLETDLISRAIQLSPSRIAVRGVDSTQSRQIFMLIDGKTGRKIREVDFIKDQQFGGFEADGHFKYDNITKRILYVQMFQNRVFCLDTNLNLLYTGHTIDTTNTNPVKIGLIEEGGVTKVMATQPRTIVNKQIEVFNNRVFVVSGLRGDNESLSDFNTYLPVDIYDEANGNYIGTVSVPRLGNKGIRDFKVTNYHWIVLYEGGMLALFDVDK